MAERQYDGDDLDAQRAHALAGRVDARDERQDGGTPEQRREEMGELADQPQRRGSASNAFDPVRATAVPLSPDRSPRKNTHSRGLFNRGGPEATAEPADSERFQ